MKVVISTKRDNLQRQDYLLYLRCTQIKTYLQFHAGRGCEQGVAAGM